MHVPPQPLPSDFPVTPKDVVDAAKRVAPHVHRTPVLTCSGLDELAGRSLKFKCEVFQRTGSFKIRGATNAALQAPENAPLVTHSSGNHAQALALAARSTGREAHVVMPRTAPAVKRQAVERIRSSHNIMRTYQQSKGRSRLKRRPRRSKVILCTRRMNLELFRDRGRWPVEFLEQCSSLDALIVPVGGGGLIGGIAVYAKWKRPSLKIIGAEPQNADDALIGPNRKVSS